MKTQQIGDNTNQEKCKRKKIVLTRLKKKLKVWWQKKTLFKMNGAIKPS